MMCVIVTLYIETHDLLDSPTQLCCTAWPFLSLRRLDCIQLDETVVVGKKSLPHRNGVVERLWLLTCTCQADENVWTQTLT